MDNNVLITALYFYADIGEDVVNFRLVNRRFNRLINNVSTWKRVKHIKAKVNVDTIIDNTNNLHWYHGFIYMDLKSDDICKLKSLYNYHRQMIIDLAFTKITDVSALANVKKLYM